LLLLNIAVTWTFGNTSSQSMLLIDGTHWIKETLTVEVSMVLLLRTNYTVTGKNGPPKHVKITL